MRFLWSVSTQVPAAARDAFLAWLERVGRACREDGEVVGFYVVESEADPGHFCEFYEFADEAAARAFAQGAKWRQVAADRRRFRPDDAVTSAWRQRI